MKQIINQIYVNNIFSLHGSNLLIPNLLKNRLEFFLTIIFLFIPTLLLSQQYETEISADQIIANPNGTLQAQGNVMVRHGSVSVKAEALSFNQKTNSIKFMQISEFYDGQEIRFLAREADINNELSEGIIKAATLFLDETIRIKADEVNLKNGEISDVNRISMVTSCEECNGKKPNWHLSASSAKRDVENANIVYKDVTVRVKGIPVAYMPYLRMPDPSVDRARGFLVPEAVLTSNLASGLKLPYFIPMGISSDILVTPYLSSKTKTLEFRYRKKFRKGDLTFNGAFSDDDLGDGSLRYFNQLFGNFKFGHGVDLNFNVGRVRDTSYLGDYAYSEESDLYSEFFLGKTIVEKKQFFDGDLSYLREKEKDNFLNEYYSLFGAYVREIDLSNLPGKLRLSANLNSSINVNDNNSVSRPPSSALLGIDYNQLNYLKSIKFSTQLFSNLSSFVNSADSGTTSEEFSLQYGALSSISTPSYIEGAGKILFFNPNLTVAWNGQENDIVGDYFIGMEELSWGNIYSGKKISSTTESETGLSISLGFENQVLWENGQRLEISLAASKIDKLTFTPTSNFGLVGRKLNYLGKFFIQTRQKNSVSANTLFSSAGQILKGDLRGRYTHNKFDLNAKYDFLGQVMDNRLSDDLRAISFASSYNFLENFLISTSGRYDLASDQIATTSIGLGMSMGFWNFNLNQKYLKENREKFSLSAIYDDECTRLMFSFENRYQDLGSSASVKSLMFRVQLKPFAKVVFSQGDDQVTF